MFAENVISWPFIFTDVVKARPETAKEKIIKRSPQEAFENFDVDTTPAEEGRKL